jgi:hypothetical protein
MRLYDDIVSSIYSGIREGINFSLRHFWYTVFIGFCISATALSVLSMVVVSNLKEMAQPRVYHNNPFVEK